MMQSSNVHSHIPRLKDAVVLGIVHLHKDRVLKACSGLRLIYYSPWCSPPLPAPATILTSVAVEHKDSDQVRPFDGTAPSQV